MKTIITTGTTIPMDKAFETIAAMRLFQLVSPALPVGGFSFSHGLEYAVEAGWVKTEAQIIEWLNTVMRESLGRVDLPVLYRCMEALSAYQAPQADASGKSFGYWNDYCLASRETAEFYHADKEMGKALLRLLRQLHNLQGSPVEGDISFVAAFALAAWQWGIDTDKAMAGYLWTWLENQMTAATKIVPLGQSMAQSILWQLAGRVAPVLVRAAALTDDQLGACLPRLALASTLHETQYTRLYRS